MANIFKIDRTGNEIILGTTGTTINVASHTASKILALDASKDLEVVTIGTSLDYTRPTLNAIQDIRTSASPQFTGIELGHASDTTITRVSAGVIAIEGTNIAMVGGAHHDGFSDFVANEHIDHTSVTLTAGTGLTGGGDISANRTFAVNGLLEDLDTLGANSADSEFLVGTGAGALAWENAATARTSIGLGTGDSPTFTGLTLSGNLTIPNNGTIGQAAGPLIKFDDSNNYLVITGCNIGVGIAIPRTKLMVEGAITLKERANADQDTASYGQLWVKSDAPNILMFTDDTGADFIVDVTAV